MIPQLPRGSQPVLPFVGICATALAATLLRTADTRWSLVWIAAAVTVSVACVEGFRRRISGVGWGLLLLPFATDGVLVLLRQAQGGSVSGYAPLVILPVLWVGLTGGRREVAAITACTAFVFAAPIAFIGDPLYPATGWRGALLWTVVAALVGTVTRRGMDAHRMAAAAAASRAVGLDRLVSAQTAIAGADVDVEGVLDLVALGALAVADADAACVELLDGDEVVCTAVAGTAERFRGLRLPVDQSITGECFRTGAVLICTDSEKDSRVARTACQLVGARTLIVVPLSHGAVVKAVLIAWSSTAHDFKSYEAQLLAVLANASASAIVRAELITQLTAHAVTDELTNLPNRRGWHQLLDRALARSRRNGSALSIVLLDLDGFKTVNDELGHAAGDEVLQSLGSAWRLTLRDTDLLGRLGGDEFAVILEDTDETAADEVVRRLGQASNGICRASAGIARWDGAESAEALLSRADAEMYRHKATRRLVPGRSDAVPARRGSTDRVRPGVTA